MRLAHLPAGLPVLHARLEQGPGIADLIGQKVMAFAGIARAEKFFDGLAQAGVAVVARRAFPDHHPYTEREIEDVLESAERLGATAVTTPKDAVRLPPALLARARVVGVGLVWENDAAIDGLLDAVLGGPSRPGGPRR